MFLNKKIIYIISLIIVLGIFSLPYFTLIEGWDNGSGGGKKWNQPAKKDLPGYTPTLQTGFNPAIIPHKFNYPFNSPQPKNK